MKRTIDQQLDQWKNSANRKPLIIFGARQVGKTYAIKQFARRSFTSLAYVDFTETPQASDIFRASLAPKSVIPALEAFLGMRITPEDTLIVFDEVQNSEEALASLKYFYEEAPDYPVVAAGSLLGVKVNRSKYTFPVGKVNMMTLHPLTFEEFLQATDNELLVDGIRTAYETMSPYALHDKAMGLVREYMLVGGMPEAVSAYVDNDHSLMTARTIQQDIITAYTSDMAKYASSTETTRILEAWNSIPMQLAKENHKFQYKQIRTGARSNAYQGALAWLRSAGIITKLTRVSEGVAPLKAFEDTTMFKIYMADTGLLANAYDARQSDLAPTDGKGAVFRRGITENYVLQQLTAFDLPSYYWGIPNRGEVEFIIRDKHGDVIPIEVKSGRNVTARSLQSYREKYKPAYAIRISGKQFGMEGDFKAIPLYAAWLIGEHAANIND